jgi:hypothetical protein
MSVEGEKGVAEALRNYAENTLNNLLDWKMLNEIIITIIASCLPALPKVRCGLKAEKNFSLLCVSIYTFSFSR